MKVIRQEDDAELFRQIEDRNLLAQYDFLRTSVDVALTEPGFRITHELICRLHDYAVVHICDEPGKYRTTRGVGIKHSKHAPPHPDKVQGLMDDFVDYLDKNWDKKTAIFLAAYTLWRLCWIHPFIEGNGRTARAMCCLVLCVKLGFWLPGPNTIPKQIRDNRKPYYDALAEGDSSDPRNDYYNLGMMEKYLEELMTRQLQS